MDTDHILDRSTHDEIREWLERALNGGEALPLAEPGEPPHLAIVRLSKRVKQSLTRLSLEDGCIALVRRFGEAGSGDPAYVDELLGLATQFEISEVVPILADLARRFPGLSLTEDVQLAVLATLVDIAPHQTPAFWREILDQNPKLNAGLAFSGVVATDYAAAIGLLDVLPDDEALGKLVKRKLAFTWEEMSPGQQSLFVEGVRKILPSCRPLIAEPARGWVEARDKADAKMVNVALDASPLKALALALARELGDAAAPKATQTKLVHDDQRRVA